MNTPDKIYLNKYMIRPGMLHPAQYPADTPEFEYIRKDALLEKLNRARELRIKAGAKEQSEGIRVIDALTDLINRI